MMFGADLRPFGGGPATPGTALPAMGVTHDDTWRSGLICVAAYPRLRPNLVPDPSCACCFCRYIGLNLHAIGDSLPPV